MSVWNTHLALVVNVVEVFSDPWFRTLALDICSGGSGGGVAGEQAASSGQTSAAESRRPEEQHGGGWAQRVNMLPNKHENTEDENCVQPAALL